VLYQTTWSQNKYVIYNLSGSTFANNVIEASAFENNDLLVGIILPDSVTGIGARAFFSIALTSITIPANVTSIGSQAFADCTGLTSVTFLGEVSSIDPAGFGENGQFGYIGDLVEVYLGNTGAPGGAGTYTRAPSSLTWDPPPF
jgi:hypothetical protein